MHINRYFTYVCLKARFHLEVMALAFHCFDQLLFILLVIEHSAGKTLAYALTRNHVDQSIQFHWRD